MSKPIQDKHSKLKLSRQRKYQIRKLELGLCTTCGTNPLFTSHHCLECAVKCRNRQAKKLKCRKKYRCKTRLAQK